MTGRNPEAGLHHPATTTGPDNAVIVDSEDEVVRRVRRRVGLVAAVAFVALVPAALLVWDGNPRSAIIPGVVLASLAFQFARAALFPQRFRHLARRSHVDEVLAARGAPDHVLAAATPEERELAIRDLLDELGDGSESVWAGPLVASAGRIALGVLTLGWLAASIFLLVDGDWRSASVAGIAGLFFGGVGVIAERADRRSRRAVTLLQEARARLASPEDDAP